MKRYNKYVKNKTKIHNYIRLDSHELTCEVHFKLFRLNLT